MQEFEFKKADLAVGLQGLEVEMQSTSNVIDLEYVFKMLQLVNQDFSKLPPATQKDLIEDIVCRLTIARNKVHAEYYGQENSDIFDLNELDPKFTDKPCLTGPAGFRSVVLPRNDLVEAATTGVTHMT